MERLVRIQQALKSPKDKRNDYAKFNYRSCSDILENVKPLLEQENLVILLTDKIEEIGSQLILIATAGLNQADGKSIASTEACAIISNHPGMSMDQATGAASSYARKYALCGLLAIDDGTLDPDAQKPEEKATKQPAPVAAKKATATPKEDVQPLTPEEKIAKLLSFDTREEALAFVKEEGMSATNPLYEKAFATMKTKFQHHETK